MARREDYSLIIYWDEDDEVYWGHVEGYPRLVGYGNTFLDCVSELDLLIDAWTDDDMLWDT